MAGSVYIFTKSLEQRLIEFKDVLQSREDSVLASDIADEWSYTLQIFMEPTNWQALWKISRNICSELNITFPQYVIVKVFDVNYHDLTAMVEVESVQSNISIAPIQEVPLVQLYPTKKQEDPLINVELTANFIDQLRFFYNHLWYLWDVEDTESEDWPEKHLEPRLQLYFEMSNGTIPVKLADKIHKTKEKARKLYEKKQELEMLLQKSAIEELSSEDVVTPAVENQTYELMQIHLQLNPLVTELQFLENPLLRKLVVKQFNEEEASKKTKSGAIMVWQGGLTDEFHAFLNASKTFLDPKVHTVSTSSLESAVESAVPENIILLNCGVHCINQSLEFNLTIMGVRSITEIAGKESHSYLFSIRNASIKFESLYLNPSHVSCVLQILKNSLVELKSCVISNENSESGRGIVVSRGGSVVLENCYISGLDVAIRCNPGAHVSINNTKIEKCTYAIEAFDDSKLEMNASSIDSSKKAGIFVSSSAEMNQKGPLSILERFSNFTLSGIRMQNNTDDVVVQSTS